MIHRLLQAIRNEEPATLGLRAMAMSSHFAGTFCVALLAYGLIRLLWYPDIFWKIAGGAELFLLVSAVDAVLGPLLVLAVFDPSKGWRRLRFDFVAIVSIQALALTYGLWTAYSVRPIFLAFSVDRFNLITAIDLAAKDMAAAERSEFKDASWGRPRIIGTREPRDADEKIKWIDSALAGKDRHLLPQSYIPFVEVRHLLTAKALPLQKLKLVIPIEVEKVEKRYSAQHSHLGFVPVVAKGDWVVVADISTGELLDALAFDAFKE